MTKQAAYTAATAVDWLKELLDARADATAQTATLATNVATLATAQSAVTVQQGVLDVAVAAHLAAVVACKAAQYDLYKGTFDAAVVTRAANLATIQALIEANKAARPARGTAGARCEKALSNGTFRPARGEGTCAEGLCCGAAQRVMLGAVATVETCQKLADQTYAWQPARAPMALTMPATVDVPFTCIQGAKRLAAAASALAAAYMLA